MTELETVKEFILQMKKDIKIEKGINSEKYSSGQYENKYDYFNRLQQLNGKLEGLKEVQKFVMYLINKQRYEGFTTFNEELEYIPNDDEHLPPNQMDNWNKI
jgi:hypothetical protein